MRDFHFRPPMPEELIPASRQQNISACINYPTITYGYLQTACLQRRLENSNSLLLTEQAEANAEPEQVEGEDEQKGRELYSFEAAEGLNIDCEAIIANRYKEEIHERQNQPTELSLSYKRLEEQLNQVMQSTSWRATSIPRRIIDRAKRHRVHRQRREDAYALRALAKANCNDLL